MPFDLQYRSSYIVLSNVKRLILSRSQSPAFKMFHCSKMVFCFIGVDYAFWEFFFILFSINPNWYISLLDFKNILFGWSNATSFLEIPSNCICSSISQLMRHNVPRLSLHLPSTKTGFIAKHETTVKSGDMCTLLKNKFCISNHFFVFRNCEKCTNSIGIF